MSTSRQYLLAEGVRRPAPRSWLVACSFATASAGIRDSLVGIAWPAIRTDFGVPIDALGTLIAAFALGYISMSSASGLVARCLPMRHVIPISSAVAAVTLLGGAATDRWLALLGWFAMGGLAAGTFDATLTAHTLLTSGPRALNLLHAFYGTGAVLGPVALAGMTATGYAWRGAYRALGCALVFVTGLLILTARGMADRPPAHDSVRITPEPLPAGRPILCTALALFIIYAGLELAIGLWAFTLFVNGRGYSPLVAGGAVSAYWGGIITSRFGVALWPRPIASTPLVRWGLVMLTISLAGLARGWSMHADLAALFVSGVVAGPVFPALMSATVQRSPKGTAHAAIALQTGAATLGQAVVPAFVGISTRAVGLGAIPLGLLVCSVTAILLHESLSRITNRRALKHL